MPEHCVTALLLIDLINEFRFAGGATLARQVATIAPRVVALRDRLRANGVPVIYCNDNFGRWRSDFRDVIRRSAQGGRIDAGILDGLQPRHDDYFVLKPRHSAFHATPLELLLRHLGARRLILVGAATDSCIVCTAADAHMHQYALCVPVDGVAAPTAARNRRALALMRASFDADVRTSSHITSAYVQRAVE